MKKPKFYMMVARVNDLDDTWCEDLTQNSNFDEPTTIEEAKEIGEATVKFFNDTLRPHESPRKFLGAYETPKV